MKKYCFVLCTVFAINAGSSQSKNVTFAQVERSEESLAVSEKVGLRKYFTSIRALVKDVGGRIDDIPDQKIRELALMFQGMSWDTSGRLGINQFCIGGVSGQAAIIANLKNIVQYGDYLPADIMQEMLNEFKASPGAPTISENVVDAVLEMIAAREGSIAEGSSIALFDKALRHRKEIYEVERERKNKQIAAATAEVAARLGLE